MVSLVALKFAEIVKIPKNFIKKLFSQNYFFIIAYIVVEMRARRIQWIDMETGYCMRMARRKFVTAA